MSLINPNPFTTRPEIEGTFGVVASTHWIATAVGMAMLEKRRQRLRRRGRRCVHAAGRRAASQRPRRRRAGHRLRRATGQAGSAFAARDRRRRRATIAHYRGVGLDLVPGTGLLAACVPGTFETWMLLLRDYGTLALRDVLAPAIGYAQNGHPLVERVSATIATVAELFREHWPTSAAVYLPGGAVPATGTLFAQSGARRRPTARILTRPKAPAATGAPDRTARAAWSRGFVAEAIERFCRTQEVMDTSGRRHRGLLTADDMARWHRSVEAPLTLDYGRFTVCKTGPWSQGPVMLQQLALLQRLRSRRRSIRCGADLIHLSVECAKLAFADREAFYGDPDFVDVPIDDAAVRRLQRRAPQAHRRYGIAGTASRHRSKASAQ